MTIISQRDRAPSQGAGIEADAGKIGQPLRVADLDLCHHAADSIGRGGAAQKLAVAQNRPVGVVGDQGNIVKIKRGLSAAGAILLDQAGNIGIGCAQVSQRDLDFGPGVGGQGCDLHCGAVTAVVANSFGVD